MVIASSPSTGFARLFGEQEASEPRATAAGALDSEGLEIPEALCPG